MLTWGVRGGIYHTRREKKTYLIIGHHCWCKVEVEGVINGIKCKMKKKIV